MQVLRSAYRLWQASLPHVTKIKRQTIITRVDSVLLEVLEATFLAEYLSSAKKLNMVEQALVRLDVAKFFVLVAWDTGALTNGQHMDISAKLVEASKMLAGWKRYLEKKTPTL